jgi:hypothetical protein
VGVLFVTTTENSNPLNVLTRFVAAVICADTPDGASSAETEAMPNENIASNARPMCVYVFIKCNAA